MKCAARAAVLQALLVMQSISSQLNLTVAMSHCLLLTLCYMCCSVLDFWIKGSGLTAISLYIKDSVTKTLSRDVRFNQARLPEGVTVLDNDDDGFIRIQVALSSLRAVADNSTGSCGPYGVSSHFDQVGWQPFKPDPLHVWVPASLAWAWGFG